MTGKIQNRQKRTTGYKIAIIAIILATIAFLIMWNNSSPNASNGAPNSLATICASPSAGPTGPAGKPGADGKPGLSAYDLWISLGNKGTVDVFLDSLVGEPGSQGAVGDVKVFRGTNGLTGLRGETGAEGADGVAGEEGKSAYQIWLDLGNVGTSDDFFQALTGDDGIDGLSAYELWTANGNEGTEKDFFDSLAGVDGTPGVNGTNGVDGISAYQIWLNAGNVGSEGEFLASLVGTDGANGAPGVCTVGDRGDKGDTGSSGAPGAVGSTGASAYESWLALGNVGSVNVFLTSLRGLQGEAGPTGAEGPTGAPGPKGDQGVAGPAGPAGASGFGYFGSFFDLTNQSLTNNQPAAWKFSNVTGSSNGVQIVSAGNGSGNTRIKFPATGWYNIAFSTVISKSNSSSGEVDVWFAENGTAIPNSNTRITIAGQSQSVAAWNYFYHCTNPNDYVEVMWFTQDSSSIVVTTNPASTNPARPAVPSIILTVNQVG